jgi:S1-C subfamily serine protease
VALPDQRKGLIVLSLEPGGPAATAGVLVGDILLTVGGKSVNDTDDIQAALEPHRVGEPIEVELLRGGALQRLTVTVGDRPRKS